MMKTLPLLKKHKRSGKIGEILKNVKILNICKGFLKVIMIDFLLQFRHPPSLGSLIRWKHVQHIPSKMMKTTWSWETKIYHMGQLKDWGSANCKGNAIKIAFIKPSCFNENHHIWDFKIYHMGGPKDGGGLDCKRKSIKITFRKPSCFNENQQCNANLFT